VVDTFHYLYGLNVGSGEEVTVDLEPGVRTLVTLEALGEPDDHGERTAMFNYNGSIRPVQVRDEKASVDVESREKADASKPGHIGAPFSGAVSVSVAVGDTVKAGATVAVIEAMKMESSITSPVAGTVERIAIEDIEDLVGGDLVLVIASTE
jgi:pyruvate carboxylase